MLEGGGIQDYSSWSFLELQDPLKAFLITISPEDTCIINHWPDQSIVIKQSLFKGKMIGNFLQQADALCNFLTNSRNMLRES